MPELVALDLPGGPEFVDAVRRIWDRGDAVFPVDARLTGHARDRAIRAAAPTRLYDDGDERSLDGGRPVEPGDALIIATSGSTGEPKAVVHTHAAITASARAGNDRLEIDASDTWLACLPLAHVGGFSVIVKAMVAGSRLVVHPRFDATAVEEAARDGATAVSLVATALRRVDPSLFRVILLGGSRPPGDRPPNSVATYGLTETGSGVVYDGRPLDGVEVRIDDGEVLVRGPMLMRGYRDGTTTIDTDGWLHTGDAGAWRDDGRLQVFGRRGDMIVTGGENVWPDAVEQVLTTLPGIADVAVAGVPDAEWGQRVVAWTVVSPGATPPSLAALRDAVATAIAPYAAPKQFVIVDTLPRTALGKIRRDALVDELIRDQV